MYTRLAEALPSAHHFTFHHISTPPTRCDPLFAPLPGRKPERTYCESHFFTVSIKDPKTEESIFVFAIELLLYTTKYLTTIFVSKADSTGLLAVLNLPQTAQGSPVRSFASIFVSWLVKNRQRPGVRLVVSLFARAQNQYLFPGSVDNEGKHVLDDRQLVKWWCRTLDPVLRATRTAKAPPRSEPDQPSDNSSQGYVIVPGFDKHETGSFFPPTWRTDPSDAKKWQFGHPLEQLTATPNAPPRCLIPQFPDDPKARYVNELDEEIPDSSASQALLSPSKRGNGTWKSIKTLDQFWETMAYRQECSSGRLVGFIWVVFTPRDLDQTISADSALSPTTSRGATPSPVSTSSDVPSTTSSTAATTKLPHRPRRRRQKLSGPILPRAPKIKSSSSPLSKGQSSQIPETTPYYTWPPTGRGQVVLDQNAYSRVHDLLLKLDFDSAAAAASSTRKWTEEVAAIAGSEAGGWGRTVTGVAETLVPAGSMVGGAGGGSAQGLPKVNDISSSMVRKKRKQDSGTARDTPVGVVVTTGTAAVDTTAPVVNVLGAGMVRKKPKV